MCIRDSFWVGLNVHREGVRLVFDQDVIRLSDKKIAAVGKISAVLVQDGKLTRGEYFDQLLANIQP